MISLYLFNELSPVAKLRTTPYVENCSNVNFWGARYPLQKGSVSHVFEPLSIMPFPPGYGENEICYGHTVRQLDFKTFCMGNTETFKYKLEWYKSFLDQYRGWKSTFAWVLIFSLHNTCKFACVASVQLRLLMREHVNFSQCLRTSSPNFQNHTDYTCLLFLSISLLRETLLPLSPRITVLMSLTLEGQRSIHA